MRKSELTSKPFNGRRICQFTLMDVAKCHVRATVELTIVSHLTAGNPVTSTALLCAEHVDTITGWYEREWGNHPEMFERGE
jgi:hypothetical protein